MSNYSEHAVIKMIPCKAASILRNMSRAKMKRTTRSNGIHYYRSKEHQSLRIIHDQPKRTIEFRRELKVSYGIRMESLTYDYKNDKVLKQFHEPSNYNADFRKVQYPFITDESQHFMESLVLDMYFPSHADMLNMKQMAEDFIADVDAWENDMYANRIKRNAENIEKWEKKTGRISFFRPKHQRKSKAKRTSC